MGSAREALEEFGRELEQVGRGNDKSRDAIDVNRRRIAFLAPIEVYQQRKREAAERKKRERAYGALATRITELEARIAALEGEIVRTRAKIDHAVRHKASAEALFRK